MTDPRCNDLWKSGYRAAEFGLRCDRKPKHTGKHMNRTVKLEWWKGPVVLP